MGKFAHIMNLWVLNTEVCTPLLVSPIVAQLSFPADILLPVAVLGKNHSTLQTNNKNW